jgi:hypothetical protein
MDILDGATEGWVGFIRKNKVIFWVVGLVLVLVFAGSVWWFLSDAEQGSEQPENEISLDAETQKTLLDCEGAENQDFCRSQQLSRLARRSGALRPCLELSDNERVDCIWGVAREQMNLEFCDALEDDVYKGQCKNEVSFMLAIKNDDYSACDDISDQEKRGACKRRISGPVTSENCADRGYSEDYCANITLRDQALASRDFSFCQEINQKELREACIDELASSDFDNDGLLGIEEREYGSSDASQDTDNDGLNDREEVEGYGTDPTDPDTDGDGFNDGDEVDSGYDPAGPGQL